jgi:hypothetical protein
LTRFRTEALNVDVSFLLRFADSPQLVVDQEWFSVSNDLIVDTQTSVITTLHGSRWLNDGYAK